MLRTIVDADVRVRSVNYDELNGKDEGETDSNKERRTMRLSVNLMEHVMRFKKYWRARRLQCQRNRRKAESLLKGLTAAIHRCMVRATARLSWDPGFRAVAVTSYESEIDNRCPKVHVARAKMVLKLRGKLPFLHM